MTTPPSPLPGDQMLPLDEGDEAAVVASSLRAEVVDLRRQVVRLAAMVAAGTYWQGPVDCADGDCEEYDATPRPDHCSHLTVLHATSADALAREAYENTLGDLLDLLEQQPPPTDLLYDLAEEIRAGVLRAAQVFDDEDPRGDRGRPAVVERVVAAHLADCRTSLAEAARQRIPTLAGTAPYYGVQLILIGDEPPTLVALGHHDDRLTLAVFLAASRAYGVRHDVGQMPDLRGEIVRTWGRLEKECGDCPDGDGACPRCVELRGGGWWMTWGDSDVRPFAEGAFPVTVLELP